MAQNLQSLNLVAPAFRGLNTQDSPLSLDPSFAIVADNSIIDRRGRIAARKGSDTVTTNKTALGTDYINAIGEYRDDLGNSKLFSVGNNKILSGTTTLVDETPSNYTISANNWKIVNFNSNLYFFQRGYQPLVYNHTLGAVTPMSTIQHATGVASTMYGGEVLGAFGRLWTADFIGDKSTIYWSDLLLGNQWSGGSSGSIDISKVWPNGYDEIVALAAHNGFLIIFGRDSIVVYEGAESPASMTLSDTIEGIGCVDRGTVQNLGTDLLFMSKEGLRSIQRTIQEKSLPLSDLSKNIRNDIITNITEETEELKSVFSPENSFYLITFASQQLTYCFDLRGTLENGAYRVTRWPSNGFKSYFRDDDGTLYIGSTAGISTYSGYNDGTGTYQFVYQSPALSFGDTARLKILKKLRPTFVEGSGYTVNVKWSFDFGEAFRTAFVRLASQIPAYFNVAEFTAAEFTTGSLISEPTVNATGDGTTVNVALQTDINGQPLSVQEFNVLTLIGKTI